jgi:iron complex outermembrane receptor protein
MKSAASFRRSTAAMFFFIAAGVFAQAVTAAAQDATGPAEVGAPDSGPKAVSIPAGGLAAALDRYEQTFGVEVLVTDDVVAGLRTDGVNGEYDAATALGILLGGTELVSQPVDADTLTVTTRSVQDADRVDLSAITVLGTRRSDVPLSNVPSSITIVDRREVEEEVVTSNRIDDILSRKVPGLNPTNNGVRQIRGRTAQVFLNGVPTNEQLRASSGSDINLISPDQLAGVEVSRGANSAYGFGSPGGIIALSTPRAESTDLTLRTVLRESFNTSHFNGSHQANLYQSASQIVGAFDYQIGGSIAYDGAEYDPDGNLSLGLDNAALLLNGKESLYNFDGSFGYDLEKYGSLRLTSTAGYVDFYRTYALNPGVYRQSYGFLTQEPEGDDTYRRSYTVNLTYENEDVLGSSVKVEGFTSDTYTEVYSDWEAITYRDEQTNTYYGMRSAISTPLDFLLKDAAITYGFDFMRNSYYRPYYNDDSGAIDTYFSPDVTFDSYAPYAQLDIPILDLFLLSGGVRHEEYRGEIDTIPGVIVGGDIEDFNLTLFNAGAIYFVTDEIEVYSTFSQGAEITQLGRAARDATSADLVDPQPAKSNQYEAGVRGAWDPVTAGLAGFYTESDLLSALICDGINPCIPLREPREFWGVEANLDWRITRQWGLGGIFGWMEGNRTTDTGDTRRIPSRDVPPVILTTYIDYSPFDWWRNRVQLNYRGERDPFGDSIEYGEGRVEDLLLVNLSAGFDLGPGELAFGVRNLLNKKYTSLPAESDNSDWLWLPEQGTRLTFSYSVKW